MAAMGYWGVKSYENDAAADALDAGFDRVHGAVYEELMDDRNPLSFDQVQQKLADVHTLAAAIAALREELGADGPPETWGEDGRLGLTGIIVRHAELGVPIADELRQHAINWLENESIEWDEETLRRLRRKKEIDLLTRKSGASSARDRD
jgi:hypothetical protein